MMTLNKAQFDQLVENYGSDDEDDLVEEVTDCRSVLLDVDWVRDWDCIDSLMTYNP
jgi:hypothetical protein